MQIHKYKCILQVHKQKNTTTKAQVQFNLHQLQSTTLQSASNPFSWTERRWTIVLNSLDFGNLAFRVALLDNGMTKQGEFLGNFCYLVHWYIGTTWKYSRRFWAHLHPLWSNSCHWLEAHGTSLQLNSRWQDITSQKGKKDVEADGRRPEEEEEEEGRGERWGRACERHRAANSRFAGGEELVGESTSRSSGGEEARPQPSSCPPGLPPTCPPAPPSPPSTPSSPPSPAPSHQPTLLGICSEDGRCHDVRHQVPHTKRWWVEILKFYCRTKSVNVAL